MIHPMLDEDAMVAAVDLVARSGARGFEVGWMDDDVPVALADWWASASYRGAKITVEHHRGPVEAAEALARRVLTGGACAHCHQPVVLGSGEGCRWTRMGRRWARGCEELDR